jgi:hypothetical protein
MSSYIVVTLLYDPTWKALDWVKENCPSYITNDMHCYGYNTYASEKIDYFFGDEEDAIVFKLKWP